ncbi:hypothetical protein HanPI659440_Chr00c08g0719771 [Helianthus annuus]|nr:hypothetical protein HanIR_Chr09g0434321 [Helianthus annuus]KAJ0712508.1 hypothetical protein HanOQP8_Chr09g0335631 [Helianthus annuus]KAJ0754528.1 hypothetical protein HanPI659440_Chr09g0347851 [Helianthus annuus]KAJ0817121.1 hypothetical protein HanPI659440_Chr00c08g0719771 [Helianthus annuus]
MGKEVNNCPCELSPRNATAAAAGVTRRRKHGHPVEVTGTGDQEVGCSGKSCRSCTAAVIADCVAVCCCPCAVVNIFTLTFFKLPWMMGRKCLGLGNKKKKKLKHNEKEKGQSVMSRKDEGLETKSESLVAEEEKEEEGARFEAEKVWLELYKVDQLGFGRVSFTGTE